MSRPGRTALLPTLLTSVLPSVLALVLVMFSAVGTRALGQGVANKEALEQQRQKLLQTLREEGSILETLEQIDRSVLEQEEKLEALRQRQAAVEKRIAGFEQERMGLERGLASRRLQLQKRLRALYKYSNKGFLQVLLSEGSSTELLKRLRYLQLIVRRDMGLIEDHRKNLERFNTVKQDLERERAEVQTLTVEVEHQVTAAQEERNRKQLLLSRIRGERSIDERRLKELEVASEALARRMERLPASSAAARTAAKSPERPVVVSAAKSAPTPVPGPAVQAAAANRPAAVPEPAPAPRQEERKGFDAQRNRLPYPVPAGKVTRAFGRYKAPGMKAYVSHRGLDITAPMGADILAIYDGEVKLAEWFKGYGLLMIVDHGDNFHSIYAHASKLLKQQGDRVKTGERIAQVGDTGSFQGPYLYLEVRESGKPVNPIQWIRVPPDAMALEGESE